MRGWFKLNNAIYWLALSLWASAIISAGVTAGFVFGTLPGLGVSLENFAEYQPGQTEAHGRLAAGMILEKVFTAVDFAQVALAPMVVLTLLLQLTLFGQRLTRPGNLVRTSSIAIAVALCTYHIVFQAPAMNKELRAYWAAAEVGDIERAESHRNAFNLYHPRAELVMQSNAVLLLIAIAASASALTPSKETLDRSALQTPRLAKHR